MKTKAYVLLLCLLVACLGRLSAQVPGLINYQGRVAVGGVNFDGAGSFKFALVNAEGTFTHWSNDGTFGGEPSTAVSVPVVKGLYSVQLGDTNLPNMQSIFPTVFQNGDVWLRVWFNDGTHGFQQLTPDQRIAAVGYAMMAANVPDGSINQFKLAAGAVTGNSIQPGSINSTHLTNGAVQESNIAAGAVTREALADGAVSGTKISDGAVDTRKIAAAAIGGESWIATPNPLDGPVGRTGHSVVWTGTEFIIWGGVANVFGGPSVSNTGARFNPSTGVWINITLTGAPAARRGHTAVWTGTEMIVWGGTSAQDGESGALNSGGRYNPATDTWVNTGGGFGVPPGRRNHTAVWTGTDMIIWGGLDGGSNFLGDGSKLNGATNFWSGIAVDDAPEVRHSHTAVWTGSKMVIWGGIGPSGPDNTGNVYDAAFNIWASTPMPLTGAPDGRSGNSVVWTGTDMIVWGGEGASAQVVAGGTSLQLQNGGRYRAATNSWHPMSTTGVPQYRTHHTAVWTGHEMLVWGGNFSTDLGGGTSTAGSLDDGAVYVADTDTWRTMVQDGAPAARTGHTAAWTGREMMIWGGDGQGNLLNTGGRYRLSVIADGAVGARQLADGAVGANQLRTGAVGSSHLADGAVGRVKIATGAVGSSQLGDYSVTVDHLSLGVRHSGQGSETVTLGPDGFFELSANFTPPYVAPSFPTVTMTSDAWRTSTSRSGFTARAPGAFSSESVGTVADSASYSTAFTVEGHPAMMYVNATTNKLYYIRATNPQGTAWGTPLLISSEITGGAPSVSLVDGNPAVAFNIAGGISYVRATDSVGSAWGTNVTILISAQFGRFSFAEVDGKPALAYIGLTSSGGQIMYTSGTTASGTVWSTPQPVATPTGGTDFRSASLVAAAGRPAVAFVQTGRSGGTAQTLFYVRAGNPAGTSWPAPSNIFDLGHFGVLSAYSAPARTVEMTIVEGNPALLTARNSGGGNRESLLYLRSATPEGSGWEGSHILADEPLSALRSGGFTMIAGNPATTYSVDNLHGSRYVWLPSAAGFYAPGATLRFIDCEGLSSPNFVDVEGLPVGLRVENLDLTRTSIDPASAPPAQWTASDGTVAPLIAANVQDGAIGSSQLAQGAVQTANIAAGAVTTTQIASGAVGSAQLGDYSVTVTHLSLGTRTGDLTDGTLSTPDAGGIVVFTANFEPPFSSEPTVTMTSSRWQIGVTTSSGFTASAPGQFTDTVAAPLPNIVLGRSSSAIVQGRPAIALGVNDFGGGLWYQRASNAEGTTWDPPVQIATGEASVISMKIIGGRPAVLFASASACKFVRATNATGTAWAAPVTVPGIGSGNSPVLAEVGGKPAVASVDSPPFVGVQNISYITSSDVEGTTWSTLQTAVPAPASASTVFSSVRLIEAAGRPAISFVQAQYEVGGTQELFYIHANNGVGSAWPTPSLVYELGPLSVPGYASTTQERYVEMATIDGNPALASVAVEGGTTDKVIYLRSTTPEGSAWQTASFTAGEPYTQMHIRQLGVIAGLPMITYSVSGESAPRYVRLASATDFDPISPYTRFVRCNGSEDLLELSGKPASVFAAGEDLIVRTLDTSVPPSRWTASDGTIAPLIASNVQEGAIGSAQLAAGAVTNTQLAAGSVQAANIAPAAVRGVNIASGAVGSTQLAAGAVTNTQLAAGSVQAANIAPGAINFSALAKAPQAGVVNSSEIDLQLGKGEFTVTFPQPYTSTPVVTVSLNSDDSNVNNSSVSIQSTSPTGFSGRVQAAPLVTTSLTDEAGINSDSFGYSDQLLIYGTTSALKARVASNLLDGANQAETIDSGASFGYPSVTLLGGGDSAVAYYDESNEDLKFVRYSGVFGWRTPIVLDSTGNVGKYASLQRVDGNPAVAYYDQTNSRLKYIRSSDGAGTAWSAPVVVSSAGSEGLYCRLLVVNGRPAIAYYRSGDNSLRYVRANDATGSSWGTPVVVDDVGDPGKYCSMAIINGRPAISCFVETGNDIAYYRASDTNGTSWQARVIAGQAASNPGDTSLGIVNGNPAIAYRANGTFPASLDRVRYVRASNINGTEWGSVTTLWSGPSATGIQMVFGEDDEPQFLFHNSSSERIEAIGSRESPSSFSINWMALPQ